MDPNKGKYDKVKTEPISSKEKQQEKKELSDAAKRAAKAAPKRSGDELEGVEKIPRSQAEKEMKQAAKKVKDSEKRHT
ncbi:hypothetical protein KDH_58130 [Dictyobacter sp. S3.2.2.5]|uniref:Uncharacterized protein n=1 Tax=Dictyobacter halimunensis TaxID=3026934 RepID=A0ABQ6FXH4_9CHLR|nr:hypothetical protein KDH_58130 [Dictyobacter sp. S3.2.2.5]